MEIKEIRKLIENSGFSPERIAQILRVFDEKLSDEQRVELGKIFEKMEAEKQNLFEKYQTKLNAFLVQFTEFIRGFVKKKKRQFFEFAEKTSRKKESADLANLEEFL